MTSAEAWFCIALRPRKPEGSLGRTAQDGHLDSHTAPELSTTTIWTEPSSLNIKEVWELGGLLTTDHHMERALSSLCRSANCGLGLEEAMSVMYLSKPSIVAVVAAAITFRLVEWMRNE